MISYTKNNISLLALIISIIIFSIVHFICNPFLNNKIFKTQISINENSNENQAEVVQLVDSKAKTQRQWVNENKNITWRIQIPKINLDVHIKEGTTLETMLTAVGHFTETSSWKR